MKLRSFEAMNLFSLGKVKVDLEDRGLTLVTGFSKDEGSSNGAGKSSLANKALLWTLYGETAGGLKAGAVLNRHGKKKCFGEIDFQGVDGKSYTIRRERPAKLTLSAGNTDISAHTAKDTQLLIDKLLGLDFKTFVQTSFFGQGRTVHYPSLPPKEQKAVLEQILPMEEADRWADFADKQIKVLKPKVTEAEHVFRVCKDRVASGERRVEQANRDGLMFEEKREREVQSAQLDLTNIAGGFEAERARLDVTGRQVEGFAHGETANLLIKDQDALIGELKPLWDIAHDTASEAEGSLNKWGSRKAFLTTQLSEIDTDTGCPVCLRDYDETTVKAVEERVRQQKCLIEECVINISQCNEAVAYYTGERENVSQQIAAAQQAASDIHAQAARVDAYQLAVAGLDAKIGSASAQAQARLDAAQATENPHVELLERAQTELTGSVAEFDEADTAWASLKEEMSHLVYWRGVYGTELKLKLFEDACPFLDSRTAYHLGSLKNPQIHCEFSTVKRLATGAAKEEFNVKVWSETGGSGFESLSGGEQQMTSFAIGLALADLAAGVAGTKSSFLILDEPFTELDARNGEAVVDYLTAEVENGRDTVFLISNDEALKGLVSNRIHVIKDCGISEVSNG